MADKLHHLIHALSKSEKRYFKLYAQRFSDKADSLRIKIFDAMTKFEEYDKKEILKKLGKKYDKSRYSVEKVHLYQMILDSLVAYHAKSFSEVEILKVLQTIQILWMKGLADAAQQLIKKYKKKLYKEEGGNMIYLLNIIAMEKLLVYSAIPRPKQQAHIQKLLQEYDDTLQLMAERNQVSSLIAQSNYLRNEQLCPRNPTIEKDVHKFLDNPLFQEEYEHRRLRTKINCYRIRHHMAKLLKNYDEMLRMISALIELLPPKDLKRELTVINYSINMTTKMECYQYVEDAHAEKEMLSIAQKVRNIEFEYPSPEKIHVSIYFDILTTYVNELSFYLYKGPERELKRATQKMLTEMAAMPDTLAKAKAESTNQSLYFDIYHGLSKAHLLLGNLDKAFDFNHHLLNWGESNFMVWDYRKAVLFSLIIHFEMNNYRLIPYQSDKLEHLLKKIDAPFLLEHLLCKFLRKAATQAQRSKEQKAILQELNQALQPLLKDPYEQMEQYDFDYWKWVESKC